jgi:hypothetical protein
MQRTAQVFARSGESAAVSTLLMRAITRTGSATEEPRIARHGGQAMDVADGTFELRHSFGIRSFGLRHFPNNFPPQTISP